MTISPHDLPPFFLAKRSDSSVCVCVCVFSLPSHKASQSSAPPTDLFFLLHLPSSPLRHSGLNLSSRLLSSLSLDTSARVEKFHLIAPRQCLSHLRAPLPPRFFSLSRTFLVIFSLTSVVKPLDGFPEIKCIFHFKRISFFPSHFCDILLYQQV